LSRVTERRFDSDGWTRYSYEALGTRRWLECGERLRNTGGREMGARGEWVCKVEVVERKRMIVVKMRRGGTIACPANERCDISPCKVRLQVH
jgi:hypothetical protein